MPRDHLIDRSCNQAASFDRFMPRPKNSNGFDRFIGVQETVVAKAVKRFGPDGGPRANARFHLAIKAQGGAVRTPWHECRSVAPDNRRPTPGDRGRWEDPTTQAAARCFRASSPSKPTRSTNE